MPSRSRTIQVTVSLPPDDFRVYSAAARILARIMGGKAPDAHVLIQHNLLKRDATGVADDFLDSIGWPLDAGRAISVRRPARKPVRRSRGPVLETGSGELPTSSVDPARN